MVPIAAAPRSTRLAVRLLAALSTLPFLLPMGGDPIPSFEAEALAIVLGLAALVALVLRGDVPHVGLPAVVVLPLGFALLILVQICLGAAAQERLAALAILILLWSAVMMCLGATLRSSGGTACGVPVLAGAVLAGAVVNVALASIQALALPDGSPGTLLPMTGGRPGGNLGQPNHLAGQVAFGVVSLGYLWLTDRLRTSLAAALGLWLAWGWAVTGSRTAWLAWVVIGILAWAIAPRLGAIPGRRARAGAGFLAAALPGTIAFWSWLPHAMTAGARFEVGSASFAERLTLWEGAWRLFLAAPLAGQGHGSFASAFLGIIPDLPGPLPAVTTAHAHNLPLHVAAEYGVVGLLVLGGGLLLWWRGVRCGRWTPESLWGIAMVAVCGAHSLVEYPLWYAYFLGPVAVAAGLAEGPRLECGLRRMGRLGWAAAAGAGVIVLGPLLSDYAFLRSAGTPGATARSTADSEATVRRVEHLQKHSLLAGYADVGLHRALNLDAARLPAKIAFSVQVVRALPLPDVVFRHALLLSAHGDGAAARWWWSRAVRCYPDEVASWVVQARAAHVGVPSTEGDTGVPTAIVRQREETESWRSFSRTGG
ncbi:MAG: Wzy polymerase domain-containing protein [Burkholderiales bacterium]